MKPDHSSDQNRVAAAYLNPTSPWTEPYQNAPSQQAECAAFDSDDQRPTHDALSDIYNRGHE
ncbi:MAG: hypothetical protein U0521_19385 [Anaerolineae bacterium]